MVLKQEEINALEHRIGRKHLSERLTKQVKHAAYSIGSGNVKFYWENLEFMPVCLKFVLNMFFLRKRAESNTIDYQINEVDISIQNLPEPFEGFRILQLTDLHLDGIVDEGRELCRIIESIDYDLCVITGDFRYKTYSGYDGIFKCLNKIVNAIKCPEGIIGILGNHDYIEMVPGLEESGVKMLLNESCSIERDNESIYIIGVDDIHFYETEDLAKALTDVPGDSTKVLLAHSPEMVETAANAGIDCYLCGHTHGGQICLPGGIPVITNTRGNRKYFSGKWMHKNMFGYTSKGTGSSGLPARLFCQPEVTLHRLTGQAS